MTEINTNLDTTPLPPNNLVAKDPESAELAGYVRTKTFGRDVREAIARSIELNSIRSKSAEILASETVNVANDLTDRFNQQIGALTEDSEVIDARGGKTTLGQRLDETDEQLAKNELRSFKQSMVNHKSKRAMITLIDDDAHKGVYTKLAPIMREYNIKMTSALITGANIGLPVAGLPPRADGTATMTYEQMKELHDEGIVEFVSHTHTHDPNFRLTQMTEARLRYEFKETQRVLKALGFNHRHLVYAFGTENSFVQRIASEYFESAIHIRGGWVGENVNQYKINRQSIDETSWDEIKPEIDKAIENDGWVILTSHVDQYGGLDLSLLRRIIEYAQANNMEFVNLDEGLKEHGNLLQIGNTRINSNGKIFGDTLGVVQKTQSVTHGGGLDSFEEGKISVTRVTPSNAVAYGLQSSFTLLTYRDENDPGYSFQIAIKSDGKNTKKRIWNNQNNQWSEWISSVETLPPLYVDVNVTIQPGNTHEQVITAGRINKNHVYIIKPTTKISRYVRFETFCVDNRELIVRITNTSNAERAVNANFKIDILKNI